ncbi:MAG: response regulator [Elusimicrobia bacterium]|nr:response regulator [Elusimicrobiota bacterium]
MKILVVDDDPETRELLKVFLESEGYSVVLLEKGEPVIKTILKETFSIVLLDIRLPDMNGIELLKKIHKLDKELPVMMITAFKDAENVVVAFREGAVDCILKPLNFEYLKSSIASRARSI